ncbi:ATP12 family protein [Pararhodobacter sp. SW119]|uniref:ATP12 family chaperone protein n=1 Tax=Pararhodobacter sp. SW119 TaxID=2780075 RepID=UPI001ADFFD41|nr:ATP12 family protein [Pararhodobacter sp. SW119]
MSAWGARRFWTEVSILPVEGGFAVRLDGRDLRTPAKAPLVLPTQAFADLVAAEWAAQEGTIRPDTMPATRAANVAIDKVRGQARAVAGLISDYGATDLLCYRAAAPEALVARQAAAWDPLLDWAARRFGVSWQVTTGVMPCDQPQATLDRLSAHVAGFGAFELTAMHDLVALSGSLVIGLAVTEGEDQPETLWRISRIDEEWQISQWGEDAEAAQKAALRQRDFLNAARFFAACR